MKVNYTCDYMTVIKYSVNVELEGEKLVVIPDEKNNKQYYNNEAELIKETITDQDRLIIENNINEYINLKEKIIKAINSEKKSVSISDYKQPKKAFNNEREKIESVIESEVIRIKKKLTNKEDPHASDHDYLTQDKEILEKNKSIKSAFSEEELKEFNRLIEKAKKIKDKFEYDNTVLYSSEEKIVFCINNHMYYYLITDKKNHSNNIIEVFKEMLLKEGYKDVPELKDQIKRRYYKEDRYKVKITNLVKKNMQQYYSDYKIYSGKEYMIIYEYINGKLEKIL